MSNIMPEGNDLRNAVKWISEERMNHPEKKIRTVVDEACFKFNLSPVDAEFLFRNLCQKQPLATTD